MTAQPPPSRSAELVRRLDKDLRGDVHADAFERGRHATDASIYQMMPLAVARPRDTDDVHTCLAVARELGVPVTARGGGTSQCGQTVNHALVVDCSRHLDALLELDVAGRRCRVEPGIVLDELNRALKPHGLWFPVDISTASRATLGGMAANNSCGQRSLRYGTMRHNVHAIDAILANGAAWRFGDVPASLDGVPAEARALYADLLALGKREAGEIVARFPSVLRRVGGYNVDALVPPDDAGPAAAELASGPASTFALESVRRDAAGGAVHNLAHLLVGSEGTLAFSTAIELALAPLPRDRVLGVCHFPTFRAAMETTRHLVALGPHAVELVDATMIGLARDIPLYRASLDAFVRGEPAALLLVEFAHDSRAENLAALRRLHACMADLGFDGRGAHMHHGGVVDAVDAALQGAIAEVRKAGLNIMMSMKSEGKPVSFVEDCAVELEDLADFTAGLTEIFHRHGTEGTWYAHASVGCLHVRPVLNVKLEKDANAMRAIADEAFDLVARYKGSHSGEHGDGIARSEFHTKMFGARMVATFAEVKRRFDPEGLLNPGKIVDAPRMNERTLFRYAPGYAMPGLDARLDWSTWSGAGGGLQGAVEMCNNNGACRKLAGGVMCPSYRVTREERDSTRGRANSLRLALSGQLGTGALVSDEMHATMQLCVSCKGCRRECPTGVDMAKMKIEVLAARAATHGHSLHDRLIAHLPRYAPTLARAPWLANLRNALPALARLAECPSGFAAGRPLPRWRRDAFRERDSVGAGAGDGTREAVLFADTFDTWFEPENLRAARRVLAAAGLRVHVAHLPGERDLCCGRTYLATGMVERARHEARRTLAALLPWARRGVPIVGLEPSCLLTLRDEFLSLVPSEDAALVALHSLLLEELIEREADAGRLDWTLGSPAKRLLVHGHCHQKAFGAMGALQRTLALLPDTAVDTVETSCCGMAGAFGYGRDTHEVSERMAELDLLPAVRAAAADTLVVADGTSCRHQIADLGGRDALHVARVLERALAAAPT